MNEQRYKYTIIYKSRTNIINAPRRFRGHSSLRFAAKMHCVRSLAFMHILYQLYAQRAQPNIHLHASALLYILHNKILIANCEQSFFFEFWLAMWINLNKFIKFSSIASQIMLDCLPPFCVKHIIICADRSLKIHLYRTNEVKIFICTREKMFV